MQGTPVANPAGEHIGSIENVMIDKPTGRVAYAVMSFGGFLGMGESYHPLPWQALTYDTRLDGYVIDADRDRFLAMEAEERRAQGMPPFGRLAALIISGADDESADLAAHAFARAAPHMPDLDVLGPAPAPLAVLRGRTTDPAGFLKISRRMTLAWGSVLILFGLVRWAHLLETGLTVSSLPWGSLLGLFLLGTFDSRANARGSLTGMFAGLVAVLIVYGYTQVAFTWYVLIGACVTFAAGAVASRALPGQTVMS